MEQFRLTTRQNFDKEKFSLQLEKVNKNDNSRFHKTSMELSQTFNRNFNSTQMNFQDTLLSARLKDRIVNKKSESVQQMI